MTTITPPAEENNSNNTYSTIPREIVNQTFKEPKQDDFITFLIQEHGEKRAIDLAKRYNLGRANQGTLLWYQDPGRGYRTGQIVRMNRHDGALISIDEELVHDKFARLYNLQFMYEGCVFGEHLSILGFYQPKGLVTSPTLAVVLSALIPDIFWFAPPIKYHFNILEFAERFTDAPLYIFPNASQVTDWSQALEGTHSSSHMMTEHLADLYPMVASGGMRKNSEHMRTLVGRVKAVVSDTK